MGSPFLANPFFILKILDQAAGNVLDDLKTQRTHLSRTYIPGLFYPVEIREMQKVNRHIDE